MKLEAVAKNLELYLLTAPQLSANTLFIRVPALHVSIHLLELQRENRDF